MNITLHPAASLRIGFICILLWWAPFWMLAPLINDALGLNSGTAITVIIMAVQTIIGVFGFILVGKPTARIIKKASFKKTPGIIWYAIIHGKIKDQV